MAKASMDPQWQRAVVVLTGTVIGAVVVGTLYWAQVLFIPVALAVFLAFLLNQPVRALEHLGLGRVASVLVVVVLAAALLGGLGWLMAWQVTGLLAKLPDYTTTIAAKVETLRELGSGSDELEKMVEDVKSKPLPKDGATPGVPAAEEKPTPVVVQPPSPPWLARLPSYLSSAVELAGGLTLALVLVVFMLLAREDLRGRFLRLVGRKRMSLTTKAVDEASYRISRYLLMQAIVNGSFGLAVGVGLFVIGVEYALLWGFLAAVLRYVPYLGPWLAALFPITLSLAMFEEWWPLLAVIGLFLALELLSNNIMEPWLYGRGMGVTGVALLIAAAVWAFLWGPVGLVLSAPLTVVLVVLGKYVPYLGFFEVLLGDQPALPPDAAYYQRLMARDPDEATQVVLAEVKASPPERVYDALLVPALNYARRDRARGELTEDDEKFILQTTQEVLEDLGEREAAPTPGQATEAPKDDAEEVLPPRVRLLGCPARDAADEVALEMLGQLLDPARWEVEVLSAELLSAEQVARADEQDPAVVCIASLPPGGLARARYLCKRLRARFPEVKIVVGRWGLKSNLEENREELRLAGADEAATTLLETRDNLSAWLPILSQKRPPVPPKVIASGRKQRRKG